MGDDLRLYRTGKKLQGIGQGDHVSGPLVAIATGGNFTVTHAGQIIGDHVMVRGQKGSDKGEAARVRQKAVGHQQRRLAARAPAEIMDLMSVHFDKGLFARHRHCLGKPCRQILIASPDIDNIRAGRFHLFIHGK